MEQILPCARKESYVLTLFIGVDRVRDQDKMAAYALQSESCTLLGPVAPVRRNLRRRN